MKKWMIFMRESDGIHFLFNGEGCIRVSCINDYSEYAEIPKWHHEYGQLPNTEWAIMNQASKSKRLRGFILGDRGRYQIVARGEFKE